MPKRHREPENLLPFAVEDYGDGVAEQESCGSDEFHSSEMGNDGNVSSPAGTPKDDADDSSSVMMGSSNDDDGDGDNASLINVEFGVFEMRRDVNAVMHLIDQLCPDKMNEVDRDELGAALHESPFTCVVKIGDDDDDDEGEEEGEEEIYGMASVLDAVHDTRLESLLHTLRENVWRTVAPGILPTEMLKSIDDATGRAKCVLLVGEYVRNVPLELTSQILHDMMERVETAFNARSSMSNKAGDDAPSTVQAIFPCMFAMLSKIQRAVDAPLKTPTPMNARQDPPPKKRRGQNAAQPEEFDLCRYLFWREEDSIIYEYRDKRIATLAYRCRPQYDGQPENDIPISILYVVPYGGLMQAVAEIRKCESTQVNVVRY
ncbi:hypothetical protein TCSYLVIO_002630 [Trypanosoma cruzi]|uniref:P21-C-terminal region-binding protein n=1 Tax=Trypanosoma cruzi TaxID=5693 RepID=A0A2V2UIJ9_TRYCR|nr:hypothetical protein TCSYLVIO_002630 [Trypanosoma cruzi]PBJ78735.1 hypothetical protein BCY84_04019 [Trypanosoma cruzi cruzi]PWU83804.1 hypothetical protein C4B63_282g21 [Trypanosoma cruzi]